SCVSRPRPPPRSPLFPYTTLFRSWAHVLVGGRRFTFRVRPDERHWCRVLLGPGPDRHLELCPDTGHRRTTVGDALHRGKPRLRPDRKSTRLNSSHDQISYAVFCLK